MFRKSKRSYNGIIAEPESVLDYLFSGADFLLPLSFQLLFGLSGGVDDEEMFTVTENPIRERLAVIRRFGRGIGWFGLGLAALAGEFC